MDDDGHPEPFVFRPQLIESAIRQGDAVDVCAYIGSHEAELGDRTIQLGTRFVGVLERQRGSAAQARMRSADLADDVVVAAVEADRIAPWLVVKVRERVRRDELPIDAQLVHLVESHVDIRERASDELDVLQAIVAGPEEMHTIGVDAHLRPRSSATTHHSGEQDVRVDIHYFIVHFFSCRSGQSACRRRPGEPCPVCSRSSVGSVCQKASTVSLPRRSTSTCIAMS